MCRIIVTTKFRRNPCWPDELTTAKSGNVFIVIAREDGGWIYLAPDIVLKMEYVPELTG